MKIRDLIITDTNGDEHYIKHFETRYHEDGYAQTTIFTTIFGEQIIMKVELSDIVAGSYREELKESEKEQPK